MHTAHLQAEYLTALWEVSLSEVYLMPLQRQQKQKNEEKYNQFLHSYFKIDTLTSIYASKYSSNFADISVSNSLDCHKIVRHGARLYLVPSSQR